MTRHARKNKGLRRWAAVVAIALALVSSPDRAPGGHRLSPMSAAVTKTNREPRR